MVKEYKKGQSVTLSQDFDSIHFDCKCSRETCKLTLVDDILVSGLEHLAILFGKIVITSGYRCAEHNKEVGGKPDSQHVLGKAADVTTPVTSPLEVMHAAEGVTCFFNGGIGLYSNFTHLDVRGHKARWGISETR